MAVRRDVRIDGHAADRIGHAGRLVVMAGMMMAGMPIGYVASHAIMIVMMRAVGLLLGHKFARGSRVSSGLALDTPGGYIDDMTDSDKTSRVNKPAGKKDATLRRLSRVEGQVRGLARMVEDDRYCIDIVTQISAVRAALRRVEEEILREHVAHCVEHAIKSGDKADQRRKVAELMDVMGRAAR
jgi:DNA-binding FrmR family transcriptional regulator